MSRVWDLARFGNRVAAEDDLGATITYADLDAAGGAVARAAGAGSLAFCLCRNELGSVAGYVGMLNGGVVPLLLSADLDGGLLAGLVEAYRPQHLWVPEDMAGRFPGMSEAHRSLGYALLRTGMGGYPLHPDLALLLTTSGSTGSPKLVRQSHANVRSNAELIARYLGLDESERPITTLPMSYTYGLSVVNSHLLVGATVLVTGRGLMERGFWDFFRRAGATSFGGVPYTYEMLERLRFRRMALPSLRYLTQAGGKLSPELHERYARWAAETGRRFVVMYGQCEATARMGWLPPERALDKVGSMGVAIPGGRFRLVAEDGSEVVGQGVAGELFYEGPNVTLGYAERGEDLALGDERHGVLATGDMAQRDEDGFYYVVGRKRRFLKVFGNRVGLDELERLVSGGLGTECACAGSDDRVALFVTDPALAAPARELAASLTRLNPSAFRAVVVGAIPKSESGKTLYRELERLAEEGGAS